MVAVPTVIVPPKVFGQGVPSATFTVQAPVGLAAETQATGGALESRISHESGRVEARVHETNPAAEHGRPLAVEIVGDAEARRGVLAVGLIKTARPGGALLYESSRGGKEVRDLIVRFFHRRYVRVTKAHINHQSWGDAPIVLEERCGRLPNHPQIWNTREVSCTGGKSGEEVFERRGTGECLVARELDDAALVMAVGIAFKVGEFHAKP